MHRPNLRSILPFAFGSAFLLTLMLALGSPDALASSPSQPASRSLAASGRLAATPPMGFSTWNAFGCRITEGTVRAMASAMASDGLQAAGYHFVNVDDCWGAPKRNGSGKLEANHARFPSGMPALGKYLHARGFGFGIYADAGIHTCNKLGFPGSLGHEGIDARTFATWGVDYLKYDNCKGGQVPPETRYRAMRRALDRVSRPIVFSISTWGRGHILSWGPRMGNLWRTSRDIRDTWASMTENLHATDRLAAFAGPGHWNDPDMLEVGNPRMTHIEQRTQMSMWAMMAAPLIISTDLRRADAWTLQTLTNRAVIAIDQDRLGKQARIVHRASGLTVYSKPLANGDYAVALLNENGTARTVSTSAAAAGVQTAPRYDVANPWTGTQTTTTGALTARVAAHGTVLFRVHPVFPPPPAGWTAISALAPMSYTNGWGPIERNLSNGGKARRDGRPLQIAGRTYKVGIGTHAVSRITYWLGGRCSRLDVDVGIDDEVGNSGSVQFAVLVDGKLAAKTGRLTGAGTARHLLLTALSGRKQLTLAVNDGGDGLRNDHADWANAMIRCG
jgi:alpha-galactosidase